MYYYNLKSSRKIIHTADCFYVCNTDLDFIGCFKTLAEAYDQGYRLCKCCSPLAKLYKSEKVQIIDYCQRNGFSVHLGRKSISVNSFFSKWKITFNCNGDMVLYHKNTLKKDKDDMSEIDGYHLQKCDSKDSVIDYLEYIERHDRYRLHNPLYIPKSQRVYIPPKKGTKRYKKEQHKLDKAKRNQNIRNVMKLLDSLNSQPTVTV